MLELTGCDRPIVYAPRSQATLVRNRIGSPVRASADLGFTARIGLREGLERLIAWRRTHKSEVESRRRAAPVPA
jgi:UDP-glucose 4-epimerase